MTIVKFSKTKVFKYVECMDYKRFDYLKNIRTHHFRNMAWICNLTKQNTRKRGKLDSKISIGYSILWHNTHNKYNKLKEKLNTNNTNNKNKLMLSTNLNIIYSQKYKNLRSYKMTEY